MVTSRMMMIGLFCIGLAATLSCAARASMIFQYTGNTFTFTDPTLGGPFVGSNISGFVVLNAAAPGSTQLSPDIWSFSAGGTTVTSSDPGIIINTSNFIVISDDGNSFRNWSLFFFTPEDPLFRFVETSSGRGSVIDLVGGKTAGTLARVNNNAGVWTRAVEIPEPSTLALFATGLAGLSFMMRRGFGAGGGRAGSGRCGRDKRRLNLNIS